MKLEQAYNLMLTEYPDVLTVEHIVGILQVSDKTVYSLIKQKEIKSLKVGREFRVPKLWIIQYILSDIEDNSETQKETFSGADA